MKTTQQKAQHQRAGLIARLQALDPQRVSWSLTDTYQELLATVYYLVDRQPVAGAR